MAPPLLKRQPKTLLLPTDDLLEQRITDPRNAASIGGVKKWEKSEQKLIWSPPKTILKKENIMDRGD